MCILDLLITIWKFYSNWLKSESIFIWNAILSLPSHTLQTTPSYNSIKISVEVFLEARWLIFQLCYEMLINGGISAVGNVSGNRCESDCRSRDHRFDPSPVPYFHGDWSWNNFYGHSPPFRWIIQEGLLSVTSESMCTKYWLTACSSLPRKKCG